MENDRDWKKDGGQERDGRERSSGNSAADHADQLRSRIAGRRAGARRAAALREKEAWNASHPEWVAEFNRLTRNACVIDGELNYFTLTSWQFRNGLKSADGKIGPETLEAARKAVGEPGSADHCSIARELVRGFSERGRF